MAAFPTGLTDLTNLSRNMRVLADDGTQNGDISLAQILSLITLADIQAALTQTLDTVEDCPNAASYNVVAADRNKTKRVVFATANFFYVPANMPVGFVVDWIQLGAGQITFASVSGAGQTVLSPDGLKSAGQNGRGTLEVIAPNTWLLSGYTTV